MLNSDPCILSSLSNLQCTTAWLPYSTVSLPLQGARTPLLACNTFLLTRRGGLVRLNLRPVSLAAPSRLRTINTCVWQSRNEERWALRRLVAHSSFSNPMRIHMGAAQGTMRGNVKCALRSSASFSFNNLVSSYLSVIIFMKVWCRHDIKSNIYNYISFGLIKAGVVAISVTWWKRFPELAGVLRTKGNCEKYS